MNRICAAAQFEHRSAMPGCQSSNPDCDRLTTCFQNLECKLQDCMAVKARAGSAFEPHSQSPCPSFYELTFKATGLLELTLHASMCSYSGTVFVAGASQQSTDRPHPECNQLPDQLCCSPGQTSDVAGFSCRVCLHSSPARLH